MPKFLPLFTAMLMAFAVPAMSATINWSFKDAVFDDGGMILGSFDWDTDVNRITRIDVQTTAGQIPFNLAQDYSGGTAVVDPANDPERIIFRAGDRGLVVFGDLELGTPGTIALQGTLNGFYECITCQPFRQSVGGASLVGVEVPVSPVPLPASLPILASGLAGFGLLRRARNKKTTAL